MFRKIEKRAINQQLQGQENCEAKVEEGATQCVDFADGSLHKRDSKGSNMDYGYYYFCGIFEGYFYAKHDPKCDWIQCVICILAA
jgi:hypothetical protein